MSPALVLPTITSGLDMHSMIIRGLDMHSMIIYGLDMHSMITHEGEHDNKLLDKGMSTQHTMLSFAEVAGKTPVTLFIRNTALAACYQLQLVCCFMPDSRCCAMMC